MDQDQRICFEIIVADPVMQIKNPRHPEFWMPRDFFISSQGILQG